LHLYSSLPPKEQTFARKCIAYRDKRVGNPKAERTLRLGEIFSGRTLPKLSLASFTAIHIFPAGAFDDASACDLEALWEDEELLEELNAWEPATNWRPAWRLERRFNSDGMLLFFGKIDYCEQYIQFHHSGIIEAVDHGLHDWTLLHSRVIPAHHWEEGVLSILPPLLKALKGIGGTTPAGICISLRDQLEYASLSYEDIKNKHEISVGRDRLGIREGLLTLPFTMLSDFEEGFAVLMKPSFDALARAGGLPVSPRYVKPKANRGPK
jgi:hypothetical protein